MSEEILCSCSHAAVKGKQNMLLDDISLSVGKKQIIALISEDESAGDVLKMMAGLYVLDSGKVSYPGMEKQDIIGFPKKVQYVPDDIICYQGLNVKEFLHGMSRGDAEIETNGARLLSIFGIDGTENLLEMTFEQNRLISIIQAIMTEPALLLLNRPYDMLNKETYGQLLKEIVALYAKETGIVFASQSYDDVMLPCHVYIFFKEGRIIGRYARNQLPNPAKVISIWGGDLSSLLSNKMKMLSQGGHYSRFLYWEQNMQELALQLSMTGCENFNIEELTMEEELFGDYERWL